MKEKMYERGRLAGILGLLAIGAALLPGSMEAQRSPTGTTWDCLVNGNQGRGIAFLTFYDDFTFEGVSIMTANPPRPPASGSSTNPRGDGGGDTRGGTTGSDGSTDTPTPSFQNIYGYGAVTGEWNYNAKGNVIGFFKQTINSGEGTNATTTTVSIGFKAMVTGRRLTLVASIPTRGSSTFRGIPMREMPELSGAWYGTQSGTGQKLVEFFELAPSWHYGLYSISGTGASYTTEGWAMLSARKRIGFAVKTLEDDQLRATVGRYFPGRRTATTTGITDPATQRIHYNAHLYPAEY